MNSAEAFDSNPARIGPATPKEVDPAEAATTIGSQRFLQATLDAMSTQLAILDEQGTIIAVNRAWRDFARANAGQESRVCEGVNYLAICRSARGANAEEATPFATGLLGVLEGERTEFTLEYPCHSRKEQRWFIARVTRFLTEDGRSRLVVTHSTITERKLAELRRQETLDLLHNITNSVPGFIYQRWSHPDGTAHFTFASEGIRDIYRISPEEVLAESSKVYSVLHPEDRDGVTGSMQAASEALSPWSHEYRVRFEDGSVRWLTGRALPQRKADGSILWHGIITDITERRRLETMLQEAQRAESLGLLARGVAHDFNNLVQAILSSVDTALLHTQPGSRAQLILGLAQRYGGLAQQLGHQLMDLGQNQDHLNEDGPLEPLVTDLLAVGEDWPDGIVSMSFPPDLPQIHFNRARLSQAIGILLTNAREAMAQGGHLELGANLLSIEDPAPGLDLRPGTYLDFSVKDSGPGIAPDLLPRIFEPYWSSKAAKDVKGQGLGLAICRSVLLAHGGQVRAESQLGKGSTFHLLLPVVQSPDA